MSRPLVATVLFAAVLFAVAALALLAGMATGLQRLGLDLPAAPGVDGLIPLHGPLMVCGFFGTVVGLERAVALRSAWAWGAPVLTAAGALGLIAGIAPQAAILSMMSGAVLFLAGAVVVVRRQPALHTAALAAGAAAWVVGTLAWWLADAVPPAVAAWAAFLILTIAGERLELSRFLPPHGWKGPSAVLIFAGLLAGAALLSLNLDAGAPLFGASLLAETAWLFRFDIVRNTLRRTGLTRYMAVCLSSGYLWLAAAGLIMLTFGLPPGGVLYDAALHGLFVGFVFAMVFGHMPVILSALMKLTLPYRPRLYAPLAVLHGGLALRVAGDLLGWDDLRQWGGGLNAVAILAFLALTALSVAQARKAVPDPIGQQRLDRSGGLR